MGNYASRGVLAPGVLSPPLVDLIHVTSGSKFVVVKFLTSLLLLPLVTCIYMTSALLLAVDGWRNLFRGKKASEIQMFTQSFESKPSASPAPQMCFSFIEFSSAIMYWGWAGRWHWIIRKDFGPVWKFTLCIHFQKNVDKIRLKNGFSGGVCWLCVQFSCTPNIKYNRQCNN
jgi:hypothetical protein